MTDAHDLNPGLAGVYGDLMADPIPCVQTPECLMRGFPNLLPPAAKPADEGITGSRDDLHDDGVADGLVDMRDPPLVEEKVGESWESVEWRRCVEPTGTRHEDWIEEITWDRPFRCTSHPGRDEEPYHSPARSTALEFPQTSPEEHEKVRGGGTEPAAELDLIRWGPGGNAGRQRRR